jgi:nucleoside triphosphate diphosphatase
MPALMRAEKLQKKAATVGFDWPEANQVLDKIEEEIAELRAAIAAGQQTEIQDEMGDLMFACVNLARHLGVKSETALDSTNRKFSRRFAFIEKYYAAQGQNMADAPLKDMEAKWQEAKQEEKPQ